MLTGDVSPESRRTGEANQAWNEGTSKGGGESERKSIIFALSWLGGLAFGGGLGIVLITLVYQAPIKAVSSPRPGKGNDSPGVTELPLPLPPSSGPWPNAVCYAFPCVQAARTLHKLLNPLVEPCENFEEHVCGRLTGSSSSILESLNSGVAKVVLVESLNIRKNPLPREDARKKASALLFACLQRWSSEASTHDDLRNFMVREHLSVSGPPADTATGPADMLTLHVRLAFVYMLGGLISVVPSTPGTLSLSLDASALVTRARIHRQVFQRLSAYFTYLATIAGVQADRALLLEAVDLHANLKEALAGTVYGTQSDLDTPIVLDTTADRLTITGLPEGAFANAVALVTPYPRSAAIDVHPLVPPALAAIWKALSPGDNLYLWTSWSVLEDLARYVDRNVARIMKEDIFIAGCTIRVKHVMAVPLAAPLLMPLQGHHEAQDKVEALVRNVRACLARNASRWLRTASAAASDVIVGFPPAVNSVEKLNSRYSHYPPVQGVFLSDWLQAAAARSRTASASDLHFDPADVDVVVSRNGLVVVPAAVLVTILYGSDSVPAINLGGLGHLVARRLAQRLLVPGARPEPQCTSSPAAAHSEAADVFENLLAFECVQHVMNLMVQLNASLAQWLPMHLSLTPTRQLFTVGCFKDCRVPGSGTQGSCYGSALRRLPAFADAFGCQPVQPMCVLP